VSPLLEAPGVGNAYPLPKAPGRVAGSYLLLEGTDLIQNFGL
jgi:hypothetical protein